MKLGQAIIEDVDSVYIRTDLEFNVGDKVYIRHLKRTGVIEALPTYKSGNNFNVRMNDDQSLMSVNWFNIFTEVKKEEAA